MFVAPSFAHQLNECFYIESLPRAALVVAQSIATHQDHFGHAPGVANGVSNRYGSPLRYSKQRIGAQAKRVNDRLQIMLECLERNVANIPVREAIVSAIIANEVEAVGKELQQGSANWTLPIVLDVRHPGGGSYKWHAIADTCGCDVNAIPRATEPNLLRAQRMLWTLKIGPAEPRIQDRRSGLFPHLADESKALPSDGAYPTLPLAAVADHAPCSVDPRAYC